MHELISAGVTAGVILLGILWKKFSGGDKIVTKKPAVKFVMMPLRTVVKDAGVQVPSKPSSPLLPPMHTPSPMSIGSLDLNENYLADFDFDKDLKNSAY